MPEALLSIDGVDLVAGQTADGARQAADAPGGEATIAWRDGLCTYDFTGADPVGCGRFAGLDADAGPAPAPSIRQRPDACLQLAQLFRAERSGDIVVSARRGYDLRARWEVPEHHSTHGALFRPRCTCP